MTIFLSHKESSMSDGEQPRLIGGLNSMDLDRNENTLIMNKVGGWSEGECGYAE